MEQVRTRVEQTADKIIEYIISNKLEAGAKLPTEHAMGEILHVGRSTLREAVKTLVIRNVLEVRQGAGTFVAAKNMGIADDPLGLTFIEDKKKLAFDLLEFRICLEPRLAALAAANHTQEQLEELKRLQADVEVQIYAKENHVEPDIAFHDMIAQMSHNLVAPNLSPIIRQAVLMFVEITDRRLVQETIDTHRQIIDSIERRDTFGAADAMTLHLIYNRNQLQKVFSLENTAD